MNLKNLLFIMLVLLPVSAFAHGEEVLISLFYDLVTVIALTIFIALIKWKPGGKALLAFVLIVSVMSVLIITAKWPYTANRRLIDIVCSGVPLLSVLLTYFVFRGKFSIKKEENAR